MFKRALMLPAPGEESFFLWGPRQTGKTTLLRARYPDARWIDLLKSEQFRRYAANPEYLRQELAAQACAAWSRTIRERGGESWSASNRCPGAPKMA